MLNKIINNYNDRYFTIDYFDEMGRISVQKEKVMTGDEILLKSYIYDKNLLKETKDANNNTIFYRQRQEKNL